MSYFLYFDSDQQIAYILKKCQYYNIGEKVLAADQTVKLVAYTKGLKVLGKVMEQKNIRTA